jgi:hypothetical protein
MKKTDGWGNPYTECDICGKIISSQYRLQNKQHMKAGVLRSLKDDSEIPDLCSERCCDTFIRIRKL